MRSILIAALAIVALAASTPAEAKAPRKEEMCVKIRNNTQETLNFSVMIKEGWGLELDPGEAETSCGKMPRGYGTEGYEITVYRLGDSITEPLREIIVPPSMFARGGYYRVTALTQFPESWEREKPMTQVPTDLEVWITRP